MDPIHLAGYMKQESVLADTHKRICPKSFEVPAVHLRIPFVLDTKLRQQVRTRMFRSTVVFLYSKMEMFLDITTLKDEDIALPRNVWIQ